MFQFLLLSFSLLAQRKRNKRKGSRSLAPALRDSPVLLTKSRRLGKSHPLRGAPPSRFTAFCCAARLREMA
jgi:hypothetical protein